ncbi:kinase-like domain-containing protein [Rhexocercosporidium sp. MPI-PUGE-AT-0058]|nr:kinase-like domain-containing protein [Rhexocercosporidium sp. MPI-PUGE-AT-0058]
MLWESPWKTYEKIYDVELGGLVAVAVRKAGPVELVHVRAFETQAATKTLYVYRQLQHQNIVTALEAFTTDDSLYIVVEHMPISLEQIVRSPAYPNERQLAAILSQVVTGVAYLATEGFEHGSLTCSNILLNTDGDVKIANQECCHVKSEGRTRDITAVSLITMELMQKYVKEDGAVGVDNLHHWPSNSDALGFLSATTSAASAAELLKHPLLSRPHQKESLIGLVPLAQVCMRGRYKYTAME